MNFLQKLAAAAAKKAVLTALVGGAPSTLKVRMSRLCDDAETVALLQDVFKAMQVDDRFTVELVESLTLPAASKEILLQEEVLDYLNDFRANFKKMAESQS